MDTQRLQAKVEVLGLLPKTILDGTVAERALRQSINLLSASVSPDVDLDDTERSQVVSAVRDVLLSVPLPPTSEGLGEGTANELLQAAQAVIDGTVAWEIREEATMLAIDLLRTGLGVDRNAVVSRVNALFASSPIETVARAVKHLGGPGLPEFAESTEPLYQRCSTEPTLFSAVLAETPEEQLTPFIRAALPRNPVAVLRALDEVKLQDEDWTSVAELAISHAATLAPAQQAEILTEVARFRDETLLPCFNAYADGLTRLLQSVDEAVAAQALELLKQNPSHIEEPGRARLLASKIHGWFLTVGDKHQPSATAALLLVWAHLTPEEQEAFIGMLFDQGIKNEGRPAAVEHSLTTLASIAVRYDEKRGPNFVDIQDKFESSTDPAMRDAIIRGLARMKPARTSKTSRSFWDWAKPLLDQNQ